MADVNCSHLGMITTVKQAKHRECDEYVKIGARRVICGRVRSAARRCAAITRLTAMPLSMRRAKAFCENLGRRLDIDAANGGDFRAVRITPHNSEASMISGKGVTSARSLMLLPGDAGGVTTKQVVGSIASLRTSNQ